MKELIGMGYDSIRNKFTRALTTPEIKQSAAASAAIKSGVSPYVSFHTVSKTQSLSNAFSTAFSLGAKPIANISTELSVSFKTDSKISDNNSCLVCIVIVEKNRIQSNSYSILPDIADRIKTSGLDAIGSALGNAFVSEQVSGSACYFFLESSDHNQHLSKIFGINQKIDVATLGAASASVDTTHTTQQGIEISTGKISGIGLPPSMPIGGELFSLGQDAMKKLLDKITTITNTLMQSSEEEILGYQTQELKYAASLELQPKLISLHEISLNTLTILKEIVAQIARVDDCLAAIQRYQSRFEEVDLPTNVKLIGDYKRALEPTRDFLQKTAQKIQEGSITFISEDIELYLTKLLLSSEMPAFVKDTYADPDTFKAKLAALQEGLNEKLKLSLSSEDIAIRIHPDQEKYRCSDWFSLPDSKGYKFNFELLSSRDIEAHILKTLAIHLFIKSSSIFPSTMCAFADVLNARTPWFSFNANQRKLGSNEVLQCSFSIENKVPAVKAPAPALYAQIKIFAIQPQLPKAVGSSRDDATMMLFDSGDSGVLKLDKETDDDLGAAAAENSSDSVLYLHATDNQPLIQAAEFSGFENQQDSSDDVNIASLTL